MALHRRHAVFIGGIGGRFLQWEYPPSSKAWPLEHDFVLKPMIWRSPWLGTPSGIPGLVNSHKKGWKDPPFFMGKSTNFRLGHSQELFKYVKTRGYIPTYPYIWWFSRLPPSWWCRKRWSRPCWRNFPSAVHQARPPRPLLHMASLALTRITGQKREILRRVAPWWRNWGIGSLRLHLFHQKWGGSLENHQM